METIKENPTNRSDTIFRAAYRAFVPEVIQRGRRSIRETSLFELAEVVTGIAYLGGSLVPEAGGPAVNLGWGLSYLGLRAYYLGREWIGNVRNRQSTSNSR